MVMVGSGGRRWARGGGVSSIEGTQGQQLGPEPAELGFRNTAAVDWRLCKRIACVCNRVVVKSDWPYLAMRLVGGMCGVGRGRAQPPRENKSTRK